VRVPCPEGDLRLKGSAQTLNAAGEHAQGRAHEKVREADHVKHPSLNISGLLLVFRLPGPAGSSLGSRVHDPDTETAARRGARCAPHPPSRAERPVRRR